MQQMLGKMILREIRISGCLSSIRHFAAHLLLFAFLITGGMSAESLPTRSYDLPSKQQVIGFLTETIDWYRDSPARGQIATEPADLLFFGDDRALAAQIVQLSLDYARAEAALVGGGTIPSLDPSASELQRFVKMQMQFQAESDRARGNLASLREKLVTAHGANRKKLEGAVADAESRLDLLQAQSARLRSLVEFVRAAGVGEPWNTDLGTIIDDLSRTIPELANRPSATIPSSPSLSTPSIPKAADSGILGLITDLSALGRRLHRLNEAIRSTDKLAQSSGNLRAPLAQFVNHALGDLGSDNLQASDLDALRKQKTRLDALAAQITSLSSALVALDKQRVLLKVYSTHLANWHTSGANQYRSALKKLVLRLVVLLGVLLLLVTVAVGVRRLTVHHVHDPNRRRLILIVQQVLLWLCIVLVAAFAFASDLSSLATFLGLLTAGVAVALQNVILAVLGYFLLVVKLSIRVGDRIQISGVTGELIDLGLLQFQVRELDAQEQPTGRVASFSNSFVFVSPATGMFKIDPSSSQARATTGVTASGR